MLPSSTRSVLFALLIFLDQHRTTFAFVQGHPASLNQSREGCTLEKMSATNSCESASMAGVVDPSILPGDPSLNLVTNVDLGAQKLDIMKACSKGISEITGKPEAYVAVAITDNASVIFGGTADPTALGNMYSLGAISIENNSAVQNCVTDLLEPYGVAADRIYINFFDMPRANIGWNRKTFAG